MKLVHGASWSEGTHRDRNPVVVVSHEIWQRLFGGDPSIAGQTPPLDFSSYEVLHVAPPGFDFPAGMDLFRAAYLGCAQNWDMRSLFVVARLRRGVSLERVRQRLALFGEQMERTYPRTNEGVRFRTRPLREAYVGEVRPYMLLTLALAGLVLLIACGNVVNLLLSRGLARKREIAMKTALGASRGRLVRQFLAESGVLARAGGVAGFGLAYWWTGLMKQWFRVELPSWMAIELDGRMTLFALVISELALAVALLVFAGLLVKSFWLLQQTGPGFDGAPALTFRTDPPWARYNEVDQTAPFYRRAIEELSAIPGVTGAAANHSFPLALNQNYGKPSIVIEGQSADEQLRNPFVNPQIVSPNYFEVMGIGFREGRTFDDADRPDTTPVAVISRPLARRLFGESSPAGRRVWLPGLLSALDEADTRWLQIVGGAEGVRSESLTAGLSLDIYLSNQQQFAGDTFFIVRSRQNPATLAQTVEQAIQKVDPEQASRFPSSRAGSLVACCTA